VNAILGDMNAECERLRALEVEQRALLEEQAERHEFVSSLQRELESTNRRNAQLETENISLRWEACRFGFFFLPSVYCERSCCYGLL
jgi:predicted nuclease with TOPRIM domain